MILHTVSRQASTLHRQLRKQSSRALLINLSLFIVKKPVDASNVRSPGQKRLRFIQR
jgi:hypothetical protein